MTIKPSLNWDCCHYISLINILDFFKLKASLCWSDGWPEVSSFIRIVFCLQTQPNRRDGTAFEAVGRSSFVGPPDNLQPHTLDLKNKLYYTDAAHHVTEPLYSARPR